jgi:hypothetical protein
MDDAAGFSHQETIAPGIAAPYPRKQRNVDRRAEFRYQYFQIRMSTTSVKDRNGGLIWPFATQNQMLFLPPV